MKAVDIEWDVDTEKDLDSLPSEIDIPEGMTDEDKISDYLSEQTGFCHKGYVLEREFADIKPGDKVICCDEYAHDYEEHELLISGIEFEDGYMVAFGTDLTYPEDENDDYITRVTAGNFVRFSEQGGLK